MNVVRNYVPYSNISRTKETPLLSKKSKGFTLDSKVENIFRRYIVKT